MPAQYSQFMRTRTSAGWVAVYHLLHPSPLYFTTERWNCVSSSPDFLSPEELQQFVATRLVVENGMDAAELKQAMDDLSIKLSRPTILYLMLAQGCNFSCTYCPIPRLAKRYGENLLSVPDALAGINLWAEQVRGWEADGDPFFVIFYGGEPLLNKTTLVSAVEHIRYLQKRAQLPDSVELMLTTNGSLLDEGTINLCQKESISVALGVDGLQKGNDAIRVDRVNRGTFNRIVTALGQLDSASIRVFASITLSPGNLKELPSLVELLKEYRVEKIGCNLLKGSALYEQLTDEDTDSFYRRCARTLIDLFLKSGQVSYEYQIEKKVSAFTNQKFFPLDCTCYGNQLVIQADGQVTNCPFHRVDQGYVQVLEKQFQVAETAIVQRWRRRFYDNLADAPDYFALSGTGCAWSSFEQNGSDLAPDRANQIFTEEVFNELIWSRLAI